jgi:HEAT repeat protein
MGAKAAPLYPALLFDALTDQEPANRKIAIGALSTITPSRQTLIASLKRIQVSDWQTNKLIGNIAQSDRELRSEVALALRHLSPSIRERAISVIGVIPGPDPIMLSELENLTKDADEQVRQKAIETWDSLHKAR